MTKLLHEFELQFVKQCGHIDMCPCDTPISTDDLVYKYLVDTGYDDIAKDLSKLRDCRSINNGLTLQKIYDEFTQKKRNALKRPALSIFKIRRTNNRNLMSGARVFS